VGNSEEPPSNVEAGTAGVRFRVAGAEFASEPQGRASGSEQAQVIGQSVTRRPPRHQQPPLTDRLRPPTAGINQPVPSLRGPDQGLVAVDEHSPGLRETVLGHHRPVVVAVGAHKIGQHLRITTVGLRPEMLRRSRHPDVGRSASSVGGPSQNGPRPSAAMWRGHTPTRNLLELRGLVPAQKAPGSRRQPRACPPTTAPRAGRRR
jgi:hypothetical protein